VVEHEAVVGVPPNPGLVLPAEGLLVEEVAGMLAEDLDPVAAGPDPVFRVGAEVDDVFDDGGEVISLGLLLGPLAGDVDLLRPDAEIDRLSGLERLVVEAVDAREPGDGQAAVLAVRAGFDPAFEEVRVADEGRDETRSRRLVDLRRRADLLDTTAILSLRLMASAWSWVT
jgi:hypothetical protein